jgi:lysophosphatidic acid acyltransferase/lysophosphatidylinositol acyltransferase
LPRPKGFTASVLGLQGHANAVYDVTIIYENSYVPTIYDLFLGKVKKINLHVQRYLLKNLPKEDKLITDWLLEKFYEKDQRINYHYQKCENNLTN